MVRAKNLKFIDLLAWTDPFSHRPKSCSFGGRNYPPGSPMNVSPCLECVCSGKGFVSWIFWNISAQFISLHCWDSSRIRDKVIEDRSLDSLFRQIEFLLLRNQVIKLLLSISFRHVIASLPRSISRDFKLFGFCILKDITVDRRGNILNGAFGLKLLARQVFTSPIGLRWF